MRARRQLDPEPAAEPPPCPGSPGEVGITIGRPVSTQETFGRLLTGLAAHPAAAQRLVTTSPDVSVSTNLGGWINKMGVFSPAEQQDFLGTDRLLRWRQSPSGQHIELGISEMNLFLSLHALGPRPRAARRAPAAGRDRLRPLRLPRSRRLDLRPLQRGPLRRGRHAVRHLAGARGWRPPVDHHALDRDRAAGPDAGRAGIRRRPRLAAVRRPGPPGAARRRLALPPPVDPAAGPGTVRGAHGSVSATPRSGPTCWPAATGWSSPRTAPADVLLAASGAVVPEVVAAAELLGRGGPAGRRPRPDQCRPPLPAVARRAPGRRP